MTRQNEMAKIERDLPQLVLRRDWALQKGNTRHADHLATQIRAYKRRYLLLCKQAQLTLPGMEMQSS